VDFRQAAIACYEDGLKAVLHQARIWTDPRHSDWLRGPSLLAALENLPLHTWSAVLQGELLRFLHGLAWLYGCAQDGTLAETALALALRLATTPEQQAHLWLHRGWLAAPDLPGFCRRRGLFWRHCRDAAPPARGAASREPPTTGGGRRTLAAGATAPAACPHIAPRQLASTGAVCSVPGSLWR